ncbi:MAG: hypothetical protein Q8T09_23560 [Candidatus Melainabacteria bacterium]|nr:hypothetical protein [Candidatus Melainabacteria bacterium]
MKSTIDKRILFVALAALAVFAAGIAYRAIFYRDLAGTICYEMEAARRILQGQVPFRDFYFDLPLTLVVFRMPAICLAQLASAHTGGALLPADLQTGLPLVFPFASLALGSFIEVSALALLSFALCIYIVSLTKLDQRCQLQLWFLLIGFGLANFAMGYSYGSAQHIFALLLSPYLFLRLTAWSSFSVNAARPWLRFGCGLLAGFGASFDVWFILVPLAIETVEFLSRRLGGKANRFAYELLGLIISFCISWSYLLRLDPAALRELVDWIIPLKITSYYLDQIAYFGLGSTPDRRDVIYFCAAAAILSFGIVNRVALLRPIFTLMMAGFVLYQIGMSGLSTDILLVVWASCMSFALQFCYLLESSFFSRICRRYPRLSYRRLPKVQIFALVALCSISLLSLATAEILQRRENVTVLTGPNAIDPTYLELTDAFAKFSQSGESIMILNGRLLPGFPLYALVERPIAGYFISTEAFSSLANIESHDLKDDVLGKPFGWIAATKKKMFDRLRCDIAKSQPGVIVVEGGQTFDGLEKANVIAQILANYTSQGEARYHSRCIGAKEFADWNYRYNVYERHGKGQN